MSKLRFIVCDQVIVVVRGLHIHCYDYCNHKTIAVVSKDVDDNIADIVIASNNKLLAVITSTSKQLIVYNWPSLNYYKSYILPRSASKIRFSPQNEKIFVADKTGDVLMYDITKEDTGIKLLGHLSLLLNVLQSDDCKHIISSDRDEKIKVSCYPNTYNIHTYCLGHTEFVNHLEFLPHNDKYLTSTSGDGTIKCWDYKIGKQCHSINTFLDINDEELKNNFTKIMIEEGVQVNTLPIVHYSISKINESSSVLVVAVYTLNKILLYNLESNSENFAHKLLQTVDIDLFPTALKLHGSFLYVYCDVKGTVEIYKLIYDKETIHLDLDKTIKMLDSDQELGALRNENKHSIKLLYKRKFDNVQEYQERKKQRLDKS